MSYEGPISTRPACSMALLRSVGSTTSVNCDGSVVVFTVTDVIHGTSEV